MIEKRTVFILGAGASCPYGFPTARGLRSEIIWQFKDWYERLLTDRQKLGLDSINEEYPSLSEAVNLTKQFRESSTESIDLFLSRHPQFERIGKIAIALTILRAEGASKFREHAKTGEDWYFYLFNRLTREFTGREGYQGLGSSNIAFITFNYDRSLEYFLFSSLLHAFEGADPPKIEEQILRVPIIHVYGQIAPLKFYDRSEQEFATHRLGYGKQSDSFSGVSFPTIINCLHVLREKRANPELARAQSEISKAERVFFLGFGYADENLDALGIPCGLRAEHSIYGTAMGWTSKEIHDIRSRFVAGLNRAGNTYGRDQVHIRDCDCVSLLREFL
jgi:hypothetical protein